MSSTQLNQSANDMLDRAKANGLSRQGYNVFVSAASRSSFLHVSINYFLQIDAVPFKL
jgi:hypothetical protein